MNTSLSREMQNITLSRICSSLNAYKACGPDDVSPRVVKESIHCFVQPLLHVFNLSFRTGIVPKKLKIAKVIPLYKKNKHDCVENYRPIALLSIFSKILEKLMHKRLYDFLIHFDLLIPQQFGFRPKYSTSLSVINFTDYISTQLDNGNICCGLFMDLSKAFDTIDHHILLKKLFHYGVRGIPLQWFESYLSHRQQYVMIDGVPSSRLEVNLGVPQGSVLGPLLFLIYVNDVVNCSDLLTFSLFADDTVALYSHKNTQILSSVMNKELKHLSEWFKCNKLFLNFSKTKYILFRSRNKIININDYMIEIENNVIERSDKINFLGVTIHEFLHWKYHINTVSSKVSRSIGTLCKLKSFLPLYILKHLYNTLILPHFNYCNEIWGNAFNTHLQKLFILQKRAVRLITNSTCRTSSNQLFLKLKILPIFDLIRLNVLIFMYKFHMDLLPSMFNNMFHTNASVHQYPTRSCNDLRPPLARLTLRKHLIRSIGVKEWNSISLDLKSSSTLTRFKRLYKINVFEKMAFSS